MFKKVTFAIALVALLAPSAAWAQKVQITPFYGYQFGGNVDVARGELIVPASGNFGFTFDLQFDDQIAFEFYYSRQNTKLEFRERGIGSKVELFDIAVEYYQAGGIYHFSEDNLQPFVTFGAGATRWAAKTDLASDEWQLSIGGGAGVKVFVSPRIGFRLEGKLLFPFWGGASFFCGLPGGCWVGAGGQVSTVNGNVSGGLIIAF